MAPCYTQPTGALDSAIRLHAGYRHTLSSSCSVRLQKPLNESCQKRTADHSKAIKTGQEKDEHLAIVLDKTHNMHFGKFHELLLEKRSSFSTNITLLSGLISVGYKWQISAVLMNTIH